MPHLRRLLAKKSEPNLGVSMRTYCFNPMNVNATLSHFKSRAATKKRPAGAVAAQKMIAREASPPPALPQVDLACVREELEKLEARDPADAPRTDDNCEPLWDPVVVFDSISRVAWREWLQQHDGELRHWCFEPIDDKTGRVVVYHLPSKPHEATSDNIVTLIREQVNVLGRSQSLSRETLQGMASATSALEDRPQEPDGSLTPMELVYESEAPNLVVEVEFKNQTLDQLKEKLLRWMSMDAVQVAIGIKIVEGTRDHVAVLHVRGRERLEVPLGRNVTDPPPPLKFPIQTLYHGARFPPALAGHERADISVDLVGLRVSIDKFLDNYQPRKRRSRCTQELPKLAKDNKKHRNGTVDIRTQLEHVRIELEAIQQAEPVDAPMKDDEEQEPMWGPVILCESISRVAFRQLLHEHGNSTLRRWWFEPLNGEEVGRVVAFSRPHAVHKATTREIVDSLQEQLIKQGGPRIQRTFDGEYDPVCVLSDRDQQADWSFTPRESSATSAFPNLVIDVEFRNVSLRKLHEKISRWMGVETSIQVAIGIKINETTQTHVAILHVRDEEPRVIRFGGEGTNPEPLSFPIAALYHGATIPPLRDNDARGIITITIDLCELHRVIENGRRTVVKVEPKAGEYRSSAPKSLSTCASTSIPVQRNGAVSSSFKSPSSSV